MAETSARRIRVVNPDLTQSEKLILDADYSTGTTVTVKSNFGVQDNDFLVFESPGTEKAESGSVASTTGNTVITIDAALKFSHQKGTQIFRSEYNQVEISYRTSSTGAWAVLDTVGIKWDDVETLKIHQGATNAYEYRFRFKNSQSGNYSEYSPTLTGAGYLFNQVGRMVGNVRSAILDPDRKVVDDDQIINFLAEGKKVIQAMRNDWWFWKKEDEGTLTTVASTREYNLDDISSTIEYIKDIRFNDTTGDDDVIYPIKFMPDLVFDQYVTDNDEADDDHVMRFTILPGDSSSTAGYIKVDPAPENTGNGSFYIRYYEPDTDFDDVADTTAIPMPHILEDYAIAQSLKRAGKDERATIFEKRFNGPAPQNRDRFVLTGIALLEQMQIGKLKAIGQPGAIKVFRGRRVMSRLYDRAGGDRDTLAEKYFNYPIR